MQDLNRRDIVDAIALSRMAAECTCPKGLQYDVLPRLQRSLRAASSVFFDWANSGDGGSFRGVASNDVSVNAMLNWNRKYQLIDPVVDHYLSRSRHQNRHVVLSSDVMRQREFVATEFYSKFLAPISIHHVMLIGLTDEVGAPMAVLGLHRPKDAPAFTRRDVARAEMVLPHFSATLRSMRARQRMVERETVIEHLLDDSPDEGLAVLNDGLNIIYASPIANAILQATAGSGQAAIRDRAAQTEIFRRCERLGITSRGNAPVRSTSLELETSLGTREISIERASTPDKATEDRFVVRVGAHRRSLTDQDRLQSFGITGRERDVVRLVVKGMTNAEIADRLCISIRTVENHLRSIYRKTSVGNRTSLVHRLREGTN